MSHYFSLFMIINKLYGVGTGRAEEGGISDKISLYVLKLYGAYSKQSTIGLIKCGYLRIELLIKFKIKLLDQ